MSRPRGRPRLAPLLCDSPTQIDREPAPGPSPSLLAPSFNLDPDRCWFWAGPVHITLTSKPVTNLRSHHTASRRGRSYRRPTGIEIPSNTPLRVHTHFLPNQPFSPSPCFHRGRFWPFPLSARLYLRCLNPHHRRPAPITSPQPSTSALPPTAPFRDHHDWLRDTAPMHNQFFPDLPSLIAHQLAQLPPPLPPDPPYTAPEIVSHFTEARLAFDLPRAWRTITP